MSDLLRQYAPEECVYDGYPWQWAHEVVYTSREIIPNPNDEPRESTWQSAIKDLIREQAGHRCLRCGHPYRKGEHGSGEWSPCDEQCTHRGPRRWRLPGEEWHHWLDGWLIPKREFRDPAVVVEAAWRILTVHHLDEDKGNCRWWNLASLCQRCHLRMQRAVVMDRPWNYEHSDWFKPFAAGFYAFKYLGEDLTREETMARLDELLALELRFNQEVLPL